MRLPDPGRSYAVLIGTSAYRSAGLADLPAVANNLTALAEVLTDPALGGLVPEHTAVLPDATGVREVYRALRHQADRATDTLLVYFAGHGLLGSHHNELYLALADTNRDELPVSALSYEVVRRVFLDSPAANRLLILDCCYSGRAAMPHMSDPDQEILGQIGIEGTYILTATSANEMALAPAGVPHTAFTGELLTLLRTGIPDGPELLTLGTIYRHLRYTMTTRGMPVPSRHGTDTADLLALTRNPAYRSRPPTPRAGTETPPQSPGTPHEQAAEPQADPPPAKAGGTPPRKANRPLGAHGTPRSAGPRTRRAAFGSVLVLVVIAAAVTADLRLHPARPPGSSAASAGPRAPGIIAREPANIRAVEFGPDGRLLATTTADGKVDVWDPVAGKGLRTFTDPAGIGQAAFSPGGRLLATAPARPAKDSAPTARRMADKVDLWDPATGTRVRTISHPAGGSSGDESVNTVRFSSDGRLLAIGVTTANGDSSVGIWNPVSGARLSTLDGVWDMEFSPDGTLLATTSRYASEPARLWNPRTGKQVRALDSPLEIGAVAFSPDGRLLAITDWPKTTVRLWNPLTGEQVRTLRYPAGFKPKGLLTPEFSPDGKILSIVVDGKVDLWDPATGTRLRTLDIAGTSYGQAMFSPDGRLLATVSAQDQAGGRVVQLWDPATGTQLTRDTASDAAFSSDGTLLAIAGTRNSVRLWDLTKAPALRRTLTQ
ncbi:caspase, EACC1-associated type [Actinomadura scrupuli]|uniref:caspase, EACC1-associated type n=1 Tax=Actinomadura scrupuli TaxID=559629 RepID=UPI003D96D830